MAGSYTLVGPATATGLNALHDLVEQIQQEHPDIDPDDLTMLETAALELAGNIVEHGTPPDQVWYSFSVEVSADRLQALLVDTGDALPEQAGGVLDDPLAESGRGLALARAVLTELTYERRVDGNAWTMTRTRN